MQSRSPFGRDLGFVTRLHEVEEIAPAVIAPRPARLELAAAETLEIVRVLASVLKALVDLRLRSMRSLLNVLPKLARIGHLSHIDVLTRRVEELLALDRNLEIPAGLSRDQDG